MSPRLQHILSLPKLTHKLVQGSPAWDGFRLEHRGASEAAAALGLSKTMKRTELLHMKHTGLAREFSDWLQKHVLDHGHVVEAKARPHLEALIGEDLYPVTCSRGSVSASCDGLTMDDRVAMEHKQWAEDLAALVAAGLVPDEHMPQCAQVMLVTGAEELYFVVSDGTPDRMVWAKVTRPDAEPWMERIVAGWDQFDADLAAYVPTQIKEMPKAEVTLALPALFIHAKGEITTSNMEEYGVALAKRLAEVRAIALITDQDFSNAKESAKLLRDNIQQAKLAKDAMLAQTVTVGEAARMIDTWCEDMRLTALKLEQDVEREDKAKKAAMITKARGEYDQHVEALKVDTGGPWILLPAPNFAEAIKSKRNFASMQDAVDTMLANAKIAADESARKIRASLAALAEESKGFEHLFADRLSFVGKPVEDVRSLARARITEHRAAEERRAAELAERERARIRAEEEARAQRQQQEREAATHAEEERRQQAAAPAAAAYPVPNEGLVIAPAPSVVQMQPRATAAPASTSTPTLQLGAISKRLGFTVTAEFLAELGFPVVKTDRGAKLYREESFPWICDAILAHVAKVRDQQLQAA